ncbi:MAG: hypothetical protein JWN48_844 [Myxococcaceae bacterium]|nr:hypothetical protein [Myxococcaceae bacterium]
MFVVAGSSGQTGSVVADTLLRRGERVRLIVRDAAKVEAFRARGAEVLEVDLLDARALTDALRGARGAYLLVPPSMTATDVLDLHRSLITSLAQAVAAAQPAHVVCLSAIGAQQEPPVGPVASLQRLEQELKRVASDLTVVRAAYFMESLATSLPGLSSDVFPTFLRADLPIAMVATKDVGAVAARALLQGASGQRVIELEGPRCYSAIEAASELSSLVSRPIRVQEQPESELVPRLLSLGMSATVAQLSLEMLQAMNRNELLWEYDASARVHGGTHIHEVLAKLLAASCLGHETA